MFNERTKSFSPTRRRTLLSRQSHVLKLALLLLAILALTFCQTRLPTQHFVFSGNLDTETNATSSSAASPSNTTTSPASQFPRIAIITFTTSPQSYTHLSLRNHAAYARQHDYDFIVDYDVTNERDVMWGKFDMLRRVIDAGQHDWVWCVYSFLTGFSYLIFAVADEENLQVDGFRYADHEHDNQGGGCGGPGLEGGSGARRRQGGRRR